ncbi:MAG: HAD family phosphatase [Chloracidobacterium sp.]|nr:HAD family phosphatase [Chloracidobacterium sp.]
MIKLLALDLDGTTLSSGGDISGRNRDAIRAAEAAGVLVTIATGRRFRDARPIGLDLGLNAPLITHNGALLKYADSLDTIHYSLLTSEASREIVRAGKQFGGDALVSTDPHGHGLLLYDRISADNIPLQKYVAWATRLHGDDAEASVSHVETLVDVLDEHDVVHISFSGNCRAMLKLENELRTQLADSVNLLATIYPKLDFTLIDILPSDASKGHGAARLAEIEGLAPEEVMAIGDNFNDLEMLEYAGTPVVMGNADPKLLERGEFYTTLSNDECGVAAAIERFILNQENS